jgi:hypothetical protein
MRPRVRRLAAPWGRERGRSRWNAHEPEPRRTDTNTYLDVSISLSSGKRRRRPVDAALRSTSVAEPAHIWARAWRASLSIDDACRLLAKASMFVGEPTFALDGASRSLGNVSFLVLASPLLACGACFLLCKASLLDGKESIALRSASLLVCNASLLVRRAAFSIGKASPPEDYASLREDEAALLMTTHRCLTTRGPCARESLFCSSHERFSWTRGRSCRTQRCVRGGQRSEAQ